VVDKPPAVLPLADAASLPVAERWSVARTKSRCEKALAEYFSELRVPYFLPLVANRRIYGRHIRRSRLPLFPGYLFFDDAILPRQRVFESRKVAEVLAPPDPEQLRAELENLALALSVDDSLREARFGDIGREVSIKRGPFKGLHGRLTRYASRCVLVVQVSFLGKAAELEIDEAFVEPTR